MSGALQGNAAALAAALLWALCSLCFTSAGHRLGSTMVGFIRLLMGFVLFVVYGLCMRGLPLPLDASAHAWYYLSLSGVVGFFLGDLFLFKAFLLVGPRLSLLIMSVWPILTALTAWLLFGERLSGLNGIGMGLTLAGVVWVLVERNRAADRPVVPRGRGMLFAFLGAVGQAGGVILSKVGMRMTDPASGLPRQYDAFAANQIRALAALAAFALFFTFTRRWGGMRVAFRDGHAMTRLGIGALAGPFLGVALSLIALQKTGTGVASALLSTAPVWVIPLVVLRHRETVSLRALIGAVLAAAGVGFLFL